MLSKFIVNFYTDHYIEQLKNTMGNIAERFNVQSIQDFNHLKEDIYDYLLKEYETEKIIDALGFDSKGKSVSFAKSDDYFQEFLRNVVLRSELAQRMDGKSSYFIERLVKAFLKNPQQLPDRTIMKAYERIEKINGNQEREDIKPYIARNYLEEEIKKEKNDVKHILLRTVCDFIAGMTDQYAMDQYDKLYGTPRMKNY